eukprot:4865471-Amphidinium_carterae.2
MVLKCGAWGAKVDTTESGAFADICFARYMWRGYISFSVVHAGCRWYSCRADKEHKGQKGGNARA